MPKKVLVVGGAGYIGSHTNLYLNELGYKTVVFDNLIYGHKKAVQWGEFVKGDLCNLEDLKAVFSQNQFDAVVHFAAYAYVGESVTDPEKYYSNNVANTLNLLSVMRKYNVQNIVFSSTCATFGHLQYGDKIAEDHPQEPINPYGASKLMVERILADYTHAYDIRSVSLRYFNAAGADEKARIGESHDPETHLIPLVLDATEGVKKAIKVFGSDYDTPDGTCIRDYIHVSDLASAHEKALVYLFEGGQSNVFNLGNGNGFSVLEVIKAAENVTGKQVNYTLEARRPGDPEKLIGDATKANEVLNWLPKYTSLEGILDTAWQWKQNKGY